MNEFNFELDKLTILDAGETAFEKDNNGFLKLCYKGKEYEKVSLTRLLPYVSEEKYISVTYMNEEDEWKEIGVIEDISEFESEQLETVKGYLDFKYYIPEIVKIYKIRDNRMGYLFLEAETTSGSKKIAVSDWWHNFRIINDKMLAVTDSDGNRYRVSDIEKLDKPSMKKLQLFI